MNKGESEQQQQQNNMVFIIGFKNSCNNLQEELI